MKKIILIVILLTGILLPVMAQDEPLTSCADCANFAKQVADTNFEGCTKNNSAEYCAEKYRSDYCITYSRCARQGRIFCYSLDCGAIISPTVAVK